MLSCKRGRIVNRIYGSTRISSGFRTNNAAIRINKDRTNSSSDPTKISKDLTSRVRNIKGRNRKRPHIPRMAAVQARLRRTTLDRLIPMRIVPETCIKTCIRARRLQDI